MEQLVVEAKAEVDGKLAASGTLTFAIGSQCFVKILHDSRKDFSLDIGLSHRKEINTDYQKMSDVILFKNY